MPTIQAPLTRDELTTWLAEHAGPRILDDHETVRALLNAFDLLAKDGRSLNNLTGIVNTIASTPSDTGPFTPVSTAAAAAVLHDQYRITRKPTGRPPVDLPMPVVVSRHQCPFCRRYTRASITQVQDHMTRCWQNPGLACCKTCVHHQDGSHPEDDESCLHPAGPEDGYLFPVLHCPLWELEGA
ncbi:hypothetical protein [Streptomyces sp. NPDC008092]|uniref:hypothetical protein n=1 Tax=Streptomyces sp. NPDC008092 TaxID=3364808 RepID=UPI0036E17BDA